MPLQPIEPKRLYRQIADQLRALLERGEFPPGSRLPAERELARLLDVSRPSVREALIALEVEGHVEVRMGSGVYVREAGTPRAPQVTAESPLQTLRARQLIEGELAWLAAAAARPPLLRGLGEALGQMEQAIASGADPLPADRLFHLRIAQACGNAVLLRLVAELFDERNNPLFSRLGRHFDSPRNWAAVVQEHREVLQAIAQRVPQAARQAMHAHLALSHDRLTAAIGPAPAPMRTGRRAAPAAPHGA